MFLPPDQPSAGGPRALTPGLVCLAACSTLSQRPPGAQAPAPASWMTLQPPRLRTSASLITSQRSSHSHPCMVCC